MKKIIKTHILFLFLAVLTTAILYSCKDDAVTQNNNQNTPEANSISGTVTFVETDSSVFGSNSVGTYEVVAFSSWPPMGPPTASDTLVYTKSGNVYTGTYKLTGLNNGDYVIANGWRTTPGWQSPGLGIYGCDTAHFGTSTCPNNPTRATISNNAGIENINFLSWADTTKKIF